MTTFTLSPTLAPLDLDLDLAAATVVRPGDAATVDRLMRLGARIVHHGTHRDAGGAQWPCVVVRLGRLRVVVVLASDDATGATPATPGQHQARAPDRSERRRAA